MKKYKTIIGIVALFLVTVIAFANAQTSPEELLESGVYKAEVKGELQEAINIFEQILAKHSGNRPVAAQALLHLGSSYEKLGNLKAEETYQRLINEFGDQQIAVSEARIRLQKIRYDELANEVQSKDAEPSYQLALDDDVPSAHPLREKQFDLSPDGKRIVYQGKEGLYVSDNSGTLRHRIVAHNPDFNQWQVIWPHVGQPRWSLDGKWIAYLTGKRPPSKPDEDPKEYVHALALVRPDGKQGRVLTPILDRQPTGGFCWLPDGSGLTYLTREGVRTINLDGKLIRSIEGKHNHFTKIWGYSPDGRWLLFHKKTGGRDASNSETDIYVIPAEGGESVWVTQSVGRNGHPTWSADGGTIYFISGRSKNLNIWKVSFDSQSGKVADDFEQVTFYSDARIMFPITAGSENRILFALDKKMNTIHVADVADPKTYATLARGINPALSPDGKFIYYVGEGSADEDQGIFAVASDNGIPRRLTKVKPASAQKDLSPDGRTLAYFSDFEGGRGLYVLSVEGGEPRLLMKNECSNCCV
ncbi:MAG: PD40 domain-containing protein, partial [candidate division Zixibacteria bacterium]|nr:PD40 domain-containing protein [candidate division Zixibacteria bacterium]